MIICDASELRTSSRINKNQFKNIIESTTLESLTGADFMVSSLEFPAITHAHIQRHIDNHAMLIQAKRGRDMVESYQHIKAQIARMYQYNIQPWQACVLVSGVFFPNSKGTTEAGQVAFTPTNKPYIQHQSTTTKYTAFSTTMRRLLLRGVSLFYLASDEETAYFLEGLERDLKELEQKPVNSILPDATWPPPDSEPLQLLQLSKNPWLSTLCSIPGWGKKTALKVAKHYGTLFASLEGIFYGDDVPVSENKRQKAVEWFDQPFEE